MEIYWVSGSPYSWRALLTLEIKHINYGSRVLEVSKRETQSPEFRALSPRGKVPVLKDGDYVLSESLAIMTYLDRKFPDPPLFGRSPEDAGLIVKAISAFDGYIHPLLGRIVLPAFFGKVPEMAADMAAAAKELHPELGAFEESLTGRDWLVGEHISAADVAVYPFIEGLLRALGKEPVQALELGVLPFAARYPALEAWRARITALPGYDSTYPPHWREADRAAASARRDDVMVDAV
jgi:glutathione S-transferase